MRLLFRVVLFAAATAAARAAPEWPLPPLDGELSGDFSSPLLPHAPALHWHVDVTPGVGPTRHLVASVTAPGIRLEAEADVDLANRLTRWTLKDSTIDLAQWSAVAARWLPLLAGKDVRGTVTLSGTGIVENQAPSGTIAFALRAASLRDPVEGWSLDGIALEGRLAVDARGTIVRSTEPMTLMIRTITTKRFGARNLTVNGVLQSPQAFALTSARIEIAGGDMVAAPALVELQPVKAALDVTLNRIGLPDVAALVPGALRNARGRVDGTARIGWSTTAGLELGPGHLLLRTDEPAEVTLKPFPGLLTGGLPRWLLDIPDWLVHWSMPSLRKAEMGEAPIEAQSLEVTFSPTPDAQGRTAVVTLIGVPHGARATTPVNITANVYGPLNALVHLGTKAKFTIGLR